MLRVYPVVLKMMYETLEDCLQDFTQDGQEDCLPQLHTTTTAHRILRRRFCQVSQRLLRHCMTDSDDDEQVEDVQLPQADANSHELMSDLYSAYFECNTSVFDGSLPKKLDLTLGARRAQGEKMSWKSGTMQASVIAPLYGTVTQSTTPAVLNFLDMIVHCYMRQKNIYSLPTIMQGRMDRLRSAVLLWVRVTEF